MFSYYVSLHSEFRYAFCIQTMFGSSLPLVICRRVHVLFTLFVYSGVQHILCCVFVLFVFILCTLCCQFCFDFLIALSVFSNVYVIRQDKKLTTMYNIQMDQTSSDTKSSLNLWPGELKNSQVVNNIVLYLQGNPVILVL